MTATPLALYLFNEASSGTAPTSIADTSAGTAVNLTPHYTGTAAWSSITAGNGLTYGTDENSGCSTAAGANKIQAALSGSTTMTWEFVMDYIGASHNALICDVNDLTSAQVAGIYTGNNGGGNGTQWEMWSDFSDPNPNFIFSVPTGVTVVHLIFDSANATAADRGRLYYNGVRQTPTGGTTTTIPQNRTLVCNSSSVILLAHSGDTFSPRGTYYYMALYSAALSGADITANSTALLANNDANPNVTNPVITVQPLSQTIYAGQTATFTVSATGTGTLHYQWKQNGGNVGTDSNSYTTGTNLFSNNGDIYTVVVTDDNGNVTSSNAILTVLFAAQVMWFTA